VTDRAPRKLLRYSRTNPTLIDTGCLFRLFALIPQWRKVADMNSGSHGIRFPKLTATATLRLPTGATWRGDFPTREIDDNSGAAISVFLSHAKDRTPPARISQSLPRPPSPSPWGVGRGGGTRTDACAANAAIGNAAKVPAARSRAPQAPFTMATTPTCCPCTSECVFGKKAGVPPSRPRLCAAVSRSIIALPAIPRIRLRAPVR